MVTLGVDLPTRGPVPVAEPLLAPSLCETLVEDCADGLGRGPGCAAGLRSSFLGEEIHPAPVDCLHGAQDVSAPGLPRPMRRSGSEPATVHGAGAETCPPHYSTPAEFREVVLNALTWSIHR